MRRFFMEPRASGRRRQRSAETPSWSITSLTGVSADRARSNHHAGAQPTVTLGKMPASVHAVENDQGADRVSFQTTRLFQTVASLARGHPGSL